MKKYKNDILNETSVTKAKPFIKWVGGKGQLISQLEALLPSDFDSWTDVTYMEPFVGGGAMLFHVLQTYRNITKAVINDINEDLATCYRIIRDQPKELIEGLEEIQREYNFLRDEDSRRDYFLKKRSLYNTKNLVDIQNSALFIFLNRTCFNGLYRVNKSGLFNVPFGRYASPTICNKETIMADSRLLQKVEILNGDFETVLSKASGNTFFYFDPPYRPLSSTSSFNDYAKEDFNDESQVRLKRFCDLIDQSGFHFLLSNSDCRGKDGTDMFFDELYSNYHIERVLAARCVNANGSKRGKLTELAIRNYTDTRGFATEKILNQQLKLAL